MSSLNGFPGQGRPGSRPANPDQQNHHQHGQQAPRAPQSPWPDANAAAVAAAAGYGQPSWAAQAAAQPSYPQQGYAQQPRPQQAYAPQPASYAQQPAHQTAHHEPQLGSYGAADPYAPQFEPYTETPHTAAPSAYGQQANAYAQQQRYAQQQYQPAPQPVTRSAYAAPQPANHGHWPADAGNYMPQSHQAAAAARHEAEPSLSDWAPQQTAEYADSYQGQHADAGDMGFAQPAGGELDPNYADDAAEYEMEAAPPRRRWSTIAAALAGAVIVGGGMAYGYKTFIGSGAKGEPPIIKSAADPAKTKPADAGGKQFAHTDSKMMSRLGDGAPAAAAAAEGETSPDGTRKVATLVVGRDGSIQAPPAAPAAPAPAAAPAAPPVAAAAAVPGTAVTVPGLTVVDAGTAKPLAPAAPAAAAPAPQKVVVSPPPAAEKPVQVAKINPPAADTPKQATGSIAKKAPAAPVASPSVATTGSGFVAVLASVPRSDSSRMEALKRFADMQQKYGTVLAGKTPDVSEANLGTKGNFHRLVVGPPGSREQATSLCSKLKAQGYADCWVMSY